MSHRPTVVDPSDRRRRIEAVIRSLGPGEVTTYGDVAADAGLGRQARLVGRILAVGGDELPWWRVVTAAGRLVPGNELEHAARLRTEGVEIAGDRVRRAPIGRFAPARRVRPGP